MRNHNWLISIRAGMMILVNQPKDSECHSHVTISPLVVPCSKVLALPLFAVSWALFNVWRVAFRQAGCLRIQIKKTWRNGKKRMVLPCLGKKKAVVRYVFTFLLIKDVDVDIKHVESNKENWVLYNTQGGCNRQTWSNVWIQACHLMGIYIYID